MSFDLFPFLISLCSLRIKSKRSWSHAASKIPAPLHLIGYGLQLCSQTFASLRLWCCCIQMNLAVKLQQALPVHLHHRRRETPAVGWLFLHDPTHSRPKPSRSAQNAVFFFSSMCMYVTLSLAAAEWSVHIAFCLSESFRCRGNRFSSSLCAAKCQTVNENNSKQAAKGQQIRSFSV